MPWPTLLLSEAGYCCAAIFFGSKHALRSLGRFVMASNRSRFGLSRMHNFLMAEAGEPDLPLTGVQSSPRDMRSLLLASTREGRRRAGSSRAAGRLTSASRRGSPTDELFYINNFFYNWPCIQKRAGVALGHRRRLVVRRRREHVFIVVVQPVVEALV